MILRSSWRQWASVLGTLTLFLQLGHSEAFWNPSTFINGDGSGQCSSIPAGSFPAGGVTIQLTDSSFNSFEFAVCPGQTYGIGVASISPKTGLLIVSPDAELSSPPGTSGGSIDSICPNRAYSDVSSTLFGTVVDVPCSATELTTVVLTSSALSSSPENLDRMTWPIGSSCPDVCGNSPGNSGVNTPGNNPGNSGVNTPGNNPGNSGVNTPATNTPTRSTNTNSATSSNSSDGKKGVNAGAVAGGVIGGLAALALIVGLAVFFVRRKRQQAALTPPPPLPIVKPAVNDNTNSTTNTTFPPPNETTNTNTSSKQGSRQSQTRTHSVDDASGFTTIDMTATQLDVDGFKSGDPFLRGTAKEYTWTNYTAGPETFRVEAGLTDVANDQLLQYVGRQNRAFSPVVQLSSAEVKQSIQLLQSEGLLGKGGTAVVFKARWPDRFGPHGLVAVKVLKDPYETDMLDPVKQAFEFEAKVLAKVNHPNVVKMYGFCMEFPTICLILELLPTSLKDCIETTGPLASAASMSTAPSGGLEGPQRTGASMCSVLSGVTGPCTRMNLKTSLEVGTGVVAGLAYLHAKPLSAGGPTAATVSDFTQSTAASVAALSEVAEQPVAVEVEGDEEQDTVGALTSRIVHRDLKPHNILINSAGTVKISDFGLAREHDHTTVSTIHAGAGTVRYMAPELLIAGKTGQGKGAVTSKVDIYSMGIMLWQMLAGRVPYENFNMAQLTAAVLSNQRPDLKVLDDAEGASPPSAELEEFKVIVNACWRPKAKMRPTAAQLHEAMADLLRRVQIKNP